MRVLGWHGEMEGAQGGRGEEKGMRHPSTNRDCVDEKAVLLDFPFD